MSTRNVLSEEIKKIPQNLLDELYDYFLFLKKREIERKISSVPRDWDSLVEDEAWKNL